MEQFEQYLIEAVGERLSTVVLHALFKTPPQVSIRINPNKSLPSTIQSHLNSALQQGDRVKWCSSGLYLNERPNFTYDPAFHAGAYYVQEPSSMFLEVIKPLFKEPQVVLDLCAAPGGKSTHLLSLLHPQSKFIANEVIKSRVAPLRENLTKWGAPNSTITSMEAGLIANRAIFHNLLFDIILVDAPCSGEGLFRKEPQAAKEWSIEKVHHSAARQRRILKEIWPALKPGGHLIYSTCTFNIYENDQNVEWLQREFGGSVVDLSQLYPTTDIAAQLQEWGVLQAPCGAYRLLPGVARGEGLFFALLQKPKGEQQPEQHSKRGSSKGSKFEVEPQLNWHYNPSTPRIELSCHNAILYLKGHTFKLEEGTPLGPLLFTYGNLPLGYGKNIGSRVNNLYPKGWRIRQ
ncbi:MAG: hypothetical protein WC960_03425 [Bacteroidales bacterium]